MLLTLEQIKAAQLFCAKKHNKYSAIMFDKGYMVATDGVAMLVQPIDNDIGVSSIIASEFDGIKDKIVEITADGMVNGRIKMHLHEGLQYPWRRVIPESLEAATTNEPADYDPDYIAKIGKAAKLLTGTRYFKLRQNGAKPGVAVFNSLPGTFALIVPLRIEKLKGKSELILPDGGNGK